MFVFTLGILWFAILGMRPLIDPDEGRYGEIPREMLTTGDWIVPHLNGIVYIEKPPLQYWMTAAALATFGEHEWVVRLVPAVLGFLGVLLIGWFAWHQAGCRAGWTAGAILASCPLYLYTAQFASLDMAVTFFLIAALVAFAYAQQHRHAATLARRSMVICWAAMALATLTKGLIGFAIPAGVIVFYMLWTRDFNVLRHLSPLTGSLVAAVIAVPWFVLVAYRIPEFVNFFFLREHFARYLTDVAHRYKPWWFFLAIAVGGMLVWMPQIILAVNRSIRKDTTTHAGFKLEALLWVWVTFVLVFFSFSQSKLPGYIVPVVPALTLLVALKITKHQSSIAVSIAITALLALLIGSLAMREMHTAMPLIPRLHDLSSITRVQLLNEAVVASAMLLLCSCIAGFLWRTARIHTATMTLAFGWVAFLIALTAILRLAGPVYSSAELAAKVRGDFAYDTELRAFYQVEQYDQSLTFYLRLTSTLVDYRGELDFGLALAPEHWIPNRTQFIEQWSHQIHAIAVMPSQTYKELTEIGVPMRIVARDAGRVVVSCW